MNEVESSLPRASSRRAALAGIGAGVVALGCCVGPMLAALLGITSATVAFDMAGNLYDDWGWAFKTAGGSLAAAALAVAYRRSRSCSANPLLLRFALVLVLSAAGTYAALYSVTTWVGEQAAASAQPIELRGATTSERIASALRQVRKRYPDVTFDLEAASSSFVRFRVAWVNPEIDPMSDEYTEEVSRRVGDSREATLVLLKAIAEQVPSIAHFSAFEDLILVPTWSREQILQTEEAGHYRDFAAYTRFVMNAKALSGYSRL